jgi:hypothetical protein
MTLSVARSRGEHVKRHPRNQVRSKINFPDGRLTAPYFPELEPDVVLTHPHASGVEDLHTLW